MQTTLTLWFKPNETVALWIQTDWNRIEKLLVQSNWYWTQCFTV